MSQPVTPVVWQSVTHDAAWVAAAMQPGPNGKRFDTAAMLLSPEVPPAGVDSMYDGVNAWSLPLGAPAYAGYFNGTYANLTQIREHVGPDPTIVSVTPDGAHGAQYIDIEPGNATASSVAQFIKDGGLGFYASPGAAAGYSVQDCIDACTAAGIARGHYQVWSAHWIGRHICGPNTCGYPQANGTQYVSTSGWDESAVISPEFFGATPPPPPPPPPPPATKTWAEVVTSGKDDLAATLTAAGNNQTPAQALVSTQGHYGSLDAVLSGWVNGVLAGHMAASTVIPAGGKLWLLRTDTAPPPPPPPPPSKLPAWMDTMYHRLPPVRVNDRDTAGAVPWVRQVQLLVNVITPSLNVDGDYGPQTQAGVEAAQHRAGLPTTGWVDLGTWEVLIAGAVNASLPDVAEGSALSALVKVVQSLCEAHGLQLTIDGVYGANTKAAVEAVQRSYYPATPAEVDGVVGPVTWSLLAAHHLP